MEQIVPVRSVASYKSGTSETVVSDEANLSGVSWAAIIAGGFVSAALSLILLAFGAGVGLSSVSPWSNVGVSVSTMGKAAVLWLIFSQIMSSSMGGYLAGRLRTRWASIHTDEVYFRDTAHGFLTWAVALVITAAFLASAASSMVGTAVPSAAQAVRGTGNGQAEGRDFDPNEYFVDALFRSEGARPDSGSASVRGEAGRIFGNALRQGEVPMADRSYLDQLIAASTGLNQTDADKRVTDVLTRAKQSADAARKTVAHSLLWMFLAFLIGAFCASVAATIGGRQRDHVVTV